jgi:hypothetical protein
MNGKVITIQFCKQKRQQCHHEPGVGEVDQSGADGAIQSDKNPVWLPSVARFSKPNFGDLP